MRYEISSDTSVSLSIGWLAALVMLSMGVAEADVVDREGKFVSGGPPIYPAYCVEKGLQGYVDLEFGVSIGGSTKDPVVLDVVVYRTDPSKQIKDEEATKWFVWGAKKALENFRYEPPIVDGELVEMTGKKTRISFALE